jgi:hypothetical protein
MYVYAGGGPVFRAQAVNGSEVCSMRQTPVASCAFDVPRGNTISLLAVEGDPSVDGTSRPPQAADTLPASQAIEFAGWSPSCPQQPERGACIFVADSDLEISAEYKYMMQVVVFQIGAAGVGYGASVPYPMLKVPADRDNILNLVRCQGACEPIPVGASPWHRLTITLPKYGTLSLWGVDGTNTAFQRWEGPSCGPIPVCAF